MKISPSLNKNPMYETIYIIIGAYLSYALAHLPFFELSGDVAIFFYGVMMAHYNKYNMGPESFRNIGLTFNLLMIAAEAICFIYIGLSLQDAIILHPENVIIALVLLGVFLASRTFIVTILVVFLKIFNIKFNVKGGEWVAFISTGLIKGPMAYIFSNVLVPYRTPCLNPSDPKQYNQSYSLYVMQAMVVITLTVYCPINFLIFKCFVSKELLEGEHAESDATETQFLKETLLKGKWVVDRKKPQVFRYVDEFMLKPILIRDYFDRMVEIESMKKFYDDLAGAYDHSVHLEHSIHHELHAHANHHDKHKPAHAEKELQETKVAAPEPKNHSEEKEKHDSKHEPKHESKHQQHEKKEEKIEEKKEEKKKEEAHVEEPAPTSVYAPLDSHNVTTEEIPKSTLTDSFVGGT